MTNIYKYSRIPEFVHENLIRWRVPNGWIVNNSSVQILSGEKIFMSESMIFIPDENHDWILES